jgi:anti-anti-sigma factor
MPEAPAKPITYDIIREPGIAFVKCHGRLVAGHADDFYADLKELASTCQLLILDLKDLTHVDSMGLGTLVRLYVHARGEGCELKLLHLDKQLRNLLTLTNLLSTFGVVAAEHSATLV